MTYTEPNSVFYRDMSPRAEGEVCWDIAISCFEPLVMVTGGIGTYTRLLANLLSNNNMNDKKIALFCREGTGGKRALRDLNVTVFEVPTDAAIRGKNATQMGDEHDWYSWNLAHYLLKLTQQGHRFSLFEFSDYGAEAYFPLKMRRAGLLSIDLLAVRLHSPELMLFRDNMLPARSYDAKRLTRISRELFCFKHCDRVLYGAPPMLERVDSECRRFGTEITGKSEHVEHPYPIQEGGNENIGISGIRLGYVGRLEVRKGILRFLKDVAESDLLCKTISDLDIVFELFGADCLDQNDRSVRSQILQLQREPGLQGRVIVHGYMAQAELKNKTSNLSGFIFPSLFENYPNALLEVLHTERPILISEAGGMPYISRGLTGMHSFNYGPHFEGNVNEFLCSIKQIPGRSQLYSDLAASVNASISQRYAELSSAANSNPGSEMQAVELFGVDFVMPFYNDAKHVADGLRSIKSVMTDRDRLYLVDDVSRQEEFAGLERAVASVFGDSDQVVIHRLPINSGPSAARNAGVRLGRNSLIQFLDSDDHLDPSGFHVTKRYLHKNPDLDFAYGVQSNFGAKSHVWVPRDSSAMTCLDENYTHCAILIRRSVFENSGGFDDEMRLHFEDWQFNCKLAFSGYRGEVVPFVTLHCAVREGSRTFRNSEREMFSRDQVIDRTCLNRRPQNTMLEGELIELIGKYSSMVNGRWRDEGSGAGATGSGAGGLALAALCSLEGPAFVRAAYGTILGRSPDESGLKFYLGQLDRGVSTRSIVTDMMSSREMQEQRRRLPSEYYSELRFGRWTRKLGINRYLKNWH